MRLIVLAIAAAFGVTTVFSQLRAQPAGGTIYVARRGWHTDIGFAVADLEPPLSSIAAQFVAAKFIFFGFGDRRYLLAKNRAAPDLLSALWPGPGLVLTTALPSAPTDAFGATNVIALQVSSRQLREAQEFIWGSLAARHIPMSGGISGPYAGSLFFNSTSSYSATHTCNTWVAESLRAASLPIHSVGVIFAAQIWGQIRPLDAGGRSAVSDQQGGLVPFWQTTVVVEP